MQHVKCFAFILCILTESLRVVFNILSLDYNYNTHEYEIISLYFLLKQNEMFWRFNHQSLDS